MPDDTPAPPDGAALLARIAALERALEHATLVIENYEMDIRNSDWTGVNLAAVGFCQGVIYRRALRTIQSLARQEMATLGGDNAALPAVVTRLHAAIADLETQAAAAPPGSPRYEALDAQLELLYQIAGTP